MNFATIAHVRSAGNDCWTASAIKYYTCRLNLSLARSSRKTNKRRNQTVAFVENVHESGSLGDEKRSRAREVSPKWQLYTGTKVATHDRSRAINSRQITMKRPPRVRFIYIYSYLFKFQSRIRPRTSAAVAHTPLCLGYRRCVTSYSTVSFARSVFILFRFTTLWLFLFRFIFTPRLALQRTADAVVEARSLRHLRGA